MHGVDPYPFFLVDDCWYQCAFDFTGDDVVLHEILVEEFAEVTEQACNARRRTLSVRAAHR